MKPISLYEITWNCQWHRKELVHVNVHERIKLIKDNIVPPIFVNFTGKKILTYFLNQHEIRNSKSA